MDQESQERFRKIDEMMLKFATNNLVIQQQIDNNNILLDQLIKSQLGLEASKERHEIMIAELKLANIEARRRESRMEALLEEVKVLCEESQHREFRLEGVVTLHQKSLRNHEGRLSQIESAA
jgi:hypothetical protein